MSFEPGKVSTGHGGTVTFALNVRQPQPVTSKVRETLTERATSFVSAARSKV